MSKIEWTGKTWNVTVGCNKVSEGCSGCYAIKEAHRLAGNPNPKISRVYSGLTERREGRTEWTGAVKFLPERLEMPLRRHKPTMWFVDSMSDWLHPSIANEQIKAMWEVMHEAHKRHGHIFQLLTKRPERFSVLGPSGIGWYAADKPVPCPEPGIWLGVSTENQRTADKRIPLLLQAPAAVRFLSCEPLLGPIDFRKVPGFNRVGLNLKDWWVIVGGESGSNARACDIEWIRSIVEQCKAAGVPCFVKQLGSYPIGHDGETSIIGKKAKPFGNGSWRRLENGKGSDPNEWPEDLAVREMPEVSHA